MVEVLAHRGATVEAFRRAKDLGSDAVELDVRRSADGVLVVHHGALLPDGRAIIEVDAADLPPRLPDLSTALDACAGMWVNVEIKNDAHDPDFDATDGIADRTLALLTGRHEDDRWLVSSFRLATIDRCKALCPAIRTAWLVDDVPDDVISTMVSRGHEALHPWVDSLRRSHIDACHGAGIEVNVWTTDDPARMTELIEWGIDGICTNVPDVARAVIARYAGPQVAEG